MEASAALYMVVNMWKDSNNTGGIECIVSDDDSTIRAHFLTPQATEPFPHGRGYGRGNIVCETMSTLNRSREDVALFPFSFNALGGARNMGRYEDFSGGLEYISCNGIGSFLVFFLHSIIVTCGA